jgi:3,4-dihydroxy 2-butanone 4-phosphate synthase / GTP cyclohydrolase II
MPFVVMDPDRNKRVQLAIDDIRAGRMVILVDDEDRENEGDLVVASDAITPEHINFMATHGRGLICMTLTEERVEQLGLPMMAANNQSPYHTAFTVSIEARENVTTGISAADRAQTIRTAIDPTKGPHDLVVPGHIFPLRARNGGVLVRTGQTEGSVDLARLAGLTPSGVICEIMKTDGTMARLPDLKKFGAEHNIRIVAVEDLIRWRVRNEVLVERELETTTQVRGHGEFNLRVYRSRTTNGLHMALWKGDIKADEPVLARVQAFCPSGDVFHATLCDCNAQMDAALSLIDDAGAGVLLYMHVAGVDQEDAVLARMRAHLGLTDAKSGEAGGGELREMGMGAQILVDLGARRLKLMTNNPRKIIGLEGYGLEVAERVPMRTAAHADTAPFLEARREQLGHLIPENSTP